ncbi:Ribosome-binding ATPase YchF [uncultured archaeon]|nr:Ribosome-binding ATPase YchF [uncultured archaeon]
MRKPSSGKSTFFSSATLIDVAIASYPFTTINPNKGIGFVRVEDAGKFFGVVSNPRHGFLVNDDPKNPIRYVPVELIDVAGLVPGANEGKGLGNKFLNDLSQADALIHVVDASGSTDAEGKEVPEGSHDPIEDVKFLEEEIELWFLKIIENNWVKTARMQEKDFGKKVAQLGTALAGIKILPWHIEKAMRDLKIDEKILTEWSPEDKRNFAHKCRVWSKPILIAANKCDLPSGEKNVKRMKEAFPSTQIIACSAASELSLRKAAKANILKYYSGWNHFEILGTLNEKQKEGLKTIQHNVLEKFGGTGVQECLDTAIFKLLGYFPVFPGGTKGLADAMGRIIPDCFLMPKDSKAIDFAYALHTDMGDGFIRAIDVKTKQVIGRDHLLKYGDVIELVFKKP